MKQLQGLLFSLLIGLSLLSQASTERLDTEQQPQSRLQSLFNENNRLTQTVGRQHRQIIRQKQELENASQLQNELDAISDQVQNNVLTLRNSQPHNKYQITEAQKALLDSPKPSERFLASLALLQEELITSTQLTVWGGQLKNDQKVEFIQLGRVALYYLTPDAQEGAIYLPVNKQWQALNLSETMELIKARNMALMEQFGDWLYLPLPGTRKGEEL